MTNNETLNVARLSPPTHATLDAILDAAQAEHFEMLDAIRDNPRYSCFAPLVSHLVASLTAAERAVLAREGSHK